MIIQFRFLRYLTAKRIVIESLKLIGQMFSITDGRTEPNYRKASYENQMCFCVTKLYYLYLSKSVLLNKSQIKSLKEVDT